MLKRIKAWFQRSAPGAQETYTYKQMRIAAETYGEIRYKDGIREGLRIAREQASRSLKTILDEQNKVN